MTGTIAPDPDGTGPLGHPAVRNSYDPAGRLIRVEEGQLAAWQSEATAPAHWPGFAMHRIVDTGYDALDRKTREAVSGGGGTAAVTEYSYDLAGRLECTAVRMNPDNWAAPLADACVPGPAHAVHGPDRISRNVYDAAGQLTEVWDGIGTPLQRREAAWTYNANGQKLSLTDARGYRAEMSWDGLGRQSRWIFPSKTTPGVADPADYEQYRYDPNGNRVWLRKRDGQAIGFEHDALNRLVIKYSPDGAVRYAYDLRGLQTAAWFTGTGWGVFNSWDGFGRLVSATSSMGGPGRTLSSQYDREGNRTVLSGDSGYHAAFDHDGLGRMTAYRGAVAIGYDPAGRRSGLAMGASSAAYAYDGAGRLGDLAHDLAGTGADHKLGFAYNPASQVAVLTASNDSYAWKGAVAVERPYSANGQNQYVSAGPAAFAYDPNGNLTSDGSTSFAYDAENRLVSASGAKTATLAYDPLGRLWQVTGPSGTTRFLYDGDRLVMEYDGAGNVLRSYVHGPGTDEPLAWYEAAAGWAVRYHHADHQGSIVALADGNGNPVAINSYDEYGIPGAGNVGRFQYTGQAWLPELGMYYYKARIYSPTLGRFLQVDPIGYDDQINLYAYVGNDPLNKTDPTGEFGDIYPTRTWDPPPESEPISPETREKIATAVEVAGVAWDVATLPTGIGSGPEGVAIGKGIAAGIRRGASDAAETRARNTARGIPESQLGPSGQPKLHFKRHPSRKRAADSARSRTARGQSPVEHSNPTRGDPHFHAADSAGKKKVDGVHDEYPRRRSKPRERE